VNNRTTEKEVEVDDEEEFRNEVAVDLGLD